MNRDSANALDENPEFDWLEIGTITAPQGLKGEVRVYPNSDFPERFEKPGQRWLLRPGEKQPQSIELLGGRYIPDKGLYIIELAGVKDRNQAETLRGCQLLVPQSDRPALGEDEYHVLDLIGLEVFNQLTSETFGTVINVISAGNDLLEVQPHSQQPPITPAAPADHTSTLTVANHGKRKPRIKSSKPQTTILIPFVKAIVPVVDLQAGRVEITPPPGLLEINEDSSTK